MEAIHVAATPAELYSAVLVDTPLGKFICIAFAFVFVIAFICLPVTGFAG